MNKTCYIIALVLSIIGLAEIVITRNGSRASLLGLVGVGMLMVATTVVLRGGK